MTGRALAPIVALAIAAAGSACAQPMVVTTDTPEYCEHLVREVSQRGGHARDVQHLLAEGRQMCDHGEIRGGIVRLRRALILLDHRSPG